MVHVLIRGLVATSIAMVAVSLLNIFHPAILPYFGEITDVKAVYALLFSCISLYAAQMSDDALGDKWRMSMGRKPISTNNPVPPVILLLLYIYVLWCVGYQANILGFNWYTYILLFSIAIAATSVVTAAFTVNAVRLLQKAMSDSPDET